MIIADAIKPANIRDMVGQIHIIGEGTLLRAFIDKGEFDSLCFYGQPGTGKTTLAKLISRQLNYRFYKFHAATTSIADIKKLLNEPSVSIETVLLVIDEIHQFNKIQQGFLLDFLDNKRGKIITTSTENPYYSLIPALRSRSYLFKFDLLDEAALLELYYRAKKYWINRNKNIKEINIKEGELKNCINMSNGDGRKFLNIIEAAFLTGESFPVEKNEKEIEAEDLPVPDRRNIIFSGSTIVYGRGEGAVFATGVNTEIGKIISKEFMTDSPKNIRFLLLVAVD